MTVPRPDGSPVVADTQSAEHYRRQLETVANNATLALFIMDEHQYCTYMNPAAEKLTGYSLAEVQGKPLHDIIHHTRPDGTPYPLAECPIDQAFPQNNQEQGEEIFVHKDGHFYPVAYTASPIREGDQPVGTIIEVRDISREKQAEAEREQLLAREQAARAEAEAAARMREEFLAIAAHELKTPLTSIKAYGQLLHRVLTQPVIDRERLGQLSQLHAQQVARFEVLINDLLDVSRIQQGRLVLREEPVDLRELSRQVLDRFEHASERTAQHSLVFHAPEPIVITGDPGRLDQVLTNLVSNALKYSPAGGEVRVQLYRRGGHAELMVRDRGMGIAAAEQARLFQPFARGEANQLSISGAGLGLYITAEIVKQHGGTISVESTPGSGSNFTVRLPLSPSR